MFIILDESGNFAKYNQEEYFVVGSFIVGDQRRISKAIRSWFHEKFPRKICKQAEIKWASSGILEGRMGGGEFYKALKNSILGSKEFFTSSL